MRTSVTSRLLKHTLTELLKRPGTKGIVLLLNLLVAAALFAAHNHLAEQRQTVETYRQDVRERWESNPDKHPHRMAHYGYVAFRQPYALSFFDRGVDSYVGNAVFLEAHRQNTVNFSAASLSTGLLRFGELSGALVLQVLLPLLLFFWGYGLIAGEREDGKLRLVFAQGARWPEVIVGKGLGLFCASLTVLVPTMVLTGIFLALVTTAPERGPTLLRYGLLFFGYATYAFLISLLTVWVSAISKTGKVSLLRLIGCWLIFILVLPKLSQVIGQVSYPSPSKIAFDQAVEEDLLKQGDSHDPDDPHFKGLKDSLLLAYNVASTDELPFNYGGFVMREGERLSTEIFREHEGRLLDRYERQQQLVRWTAFLNPYVAIKYISMALAGTDYRSYRAFKNQTETYRYELAQTMNELQMEYISNTVTTSADKSAVIGRDHWHDFPDFEQRALSPAAAVRTEFVTWLALLFWAAAPVALAFFIRRPATVI